ncbi:MAG: hypothetical protein NTW21_24670 [Verrucomicrobia bacterium]|nr:hypothetical protein [Verrucomicrobiota bacterium]
MVYDNSRRWKLAWLAGSALVVLLILLAVKLGYQVTRSAAGPLKTVAFADGGELEVIGVSVGERVVEVAPGAAAKWYLLPFFSRFSGKGSRSGTWGGLNVYTEEEGGKVIRCRLHSQNRAAMLMEFRLKESNGMAMKLPAYLVDHDAVLQDERIGPKSAPVGFFQPQDDSVKALSEAMNKAGLQVLIQHRDPQSGWLHLTGPSLFHLPWPDRYVVALSAWQRDLPTLDFRAIRADGQVVEFSLPNPDFRKAPAAGPTTTLPFVHHAGDFTLTVKQVRRFKTTGKHPFAAVDFDLHYTGAPVPGLKDGPIAFAGASKGAADEWGNVVEFARETIRDQSSFGAFLPAPSKRMALNLVMSRNDSYPQALTEGFVILEGVVTADGLGVDFKPGPDAARFGITTLPTGVIKPSGHGWSDEQGWKQLEYRVTGGNLTSELGAIESRIGEMGRWRCLVFQEERSESCGVIPLGWSGSSGSSGDRFTFDRQMTWLGSPEMLMPDAKIRVGMHGPLRDEQLEFALDLPDLVQPR